MPSQILCSESSASLLAEQAPEIDLRKRGRIHVKGKGAMSTYWVGTTQLSLLLGDSSKGGGLSLPDAVAAADAPVDAAAAKTAKEGVVVDAVQQDNMPEQNTSLSPALSKKQACLLRNGVLLISSIHKLYLSYK